MNARRFVSGLCLTLLFAAAAPPAFALANRVFVSARSGNNANACDNINTPCQTFAGVVLQVNPGGEVIVLDSGGYGPVTITHALTIEAPPGVLAFIHPPSGDAITISAGSSDAVILRGLVLNGGSGSGILVNTVGTLQVESCVISGFTGDGVRFASAGTLEMRDTAVSYSGPGQPAVIVQPASGTVALSIDRCRFSRNNLGVYVYDGVTGTISDSIFSDTIGGAIGAAKFGAGPTELSLERCIISNNSTGIVSNGAIVRVSDSAVNNNVEGLHSFSGGAILSRSNNTVEGNASLGTFTGTYSAK